jgi:tetratricopeptide (TPR) repeat protein
MRHSIALLLICAPVWAADKVGAQRAYDSALAKYLRGEFKESLALVNDAIDENSRLGVAFALRSRLWNVYGDEERERADAQSTLSKLNSSLSSLDPEELVAQGHAQIALGEINAAMTSFDTALKTRPGYAEGYAGRARGWRAQRQYKRAITDLEQALELDKQAHYYYARAQNYYDLGELDKALISTARALRRNRQHHLAFGLLGVNFARRADYKRSLAAYNKAVKLQPEYLYAYLGRAAVHLAQGRDEEAFKDYDHAVRIGSNDYSPYYNRGDAYWRRGMREDALADFRRSLTAVNLTPEYAVAIGDRFASQLLWKEAVSAYTRSHALEPSVLALMRRAKAWEALRDSKKALADLTSAAELEPGEPTPWAARGLLYSQLGEDENALADLNRAVKLAPKDAPTRVARGRFFARMSRPKLAMEDFNAAIEADPRLADAYNNRGALYANAFNDLEKALQDIAKAGELMPATPEYVFNLAMMRLRARQFSRSIDSFNEAIRLKGPVSRILQGRAEALFQLGDHTGALRDLEAAIEKDPRNASLYDTLGAVRLHSFDYEQAVRDLNQAIQLDPRHVSALIHRGMAYGGLGLYKNAVSDFRRAADVEPAEKEAWLGLCVARRLTGEPEEALRNCSRALNLDVNLAAAYMHRGLAYMSVKNYSRAIEDLAAAGQLGLKRPEALLAQAVAHTATKQYREAHRSYQEAVRLDGTARVPNIGFGQPRPSQNDYFNAIAELDASMSSATSDPYMFLVRADALHSAEHQDKAILEYTKAMEIDGSIADAYIGRAGALASQDALDAAHQDLLHALELKPSNDIRVRLGVLLTMRRDYKGALAQLAAVVRAEPANSEAYLRAGNAYFFQGNAARALDNYLLAVKHDPRSAAAHNGLGMGYFALKRPAEAIESFSRAIALNPYSDRYYKNRASTYVGLGRFGNAAMDYRLASMVNTDPALIDEYKKLITDAEARSPAGNSGS